MNTWNSIEFKTFADIQKEHNLTDVKTICRIGTELEKNLLYAYFPNGAYSDILERYTATEWKEDSLPHRLYQNFGIPIDNASKHFMFFDRELQANELKLKPALTTCTAGKEPAPPTIETVQGAKTPIRMPAEMRGADIEFVVKDLCRAKYSKDAIAFVLDARGETKEEIGRALHVLAYSQKKAKKESKSLSQYFRDATAAIEIAEGKNYFVEYITA